MQYKHVYLLEVESNDKDILIKEIFDSYSIAKKYLKQRFPKVKERVVDSFDPRFKGEKCQISYFDLPGHSVMIIRTVLITKEILQVIK